MVRYALEDSWSDIWIEGELSDVTRAASGHVYFTLNDERDVAQVRGVMFRNDARRARAQFRNGERVRLRGGLSLYEARGGFQLIARTALPAGLGDLAAQFEALRKKLEKEGLLDRARKRPLPRLPRTVGVVTSRSGAALHDIIRVAQGRCPVRLVVSDCRVQGEGAARSIVAALTAIQQLEQLDVVIVARGGGSAEDLWSFNDEQVARAIAACRVPVVSGVGHEVDITLADLVADSRAATPSNAAELVVPDRSSLIELLTAYERQLSRAMDAHIGRFRLRLERLARRTPSFGRDVHDARRRILALRDQSAQLTRSRVSAERKTLSGLRTRLQAVDPRAALSRDQMALARLHTQLLAHAPRITEDKRRTLDSLERRLHDGPARALDRRREVFSMLTARLDAMSPVKVLTRGYAIAIHSVTGRAVRSSADAQSGDLLHLRLAEGSLEVSVIETGDAENDAKTSRKSPVQKSATRKASTT